MLTTRRVPRSRFIAAALAFLCGIAVFAPGCNTTEGAGKDIKAVGSGIENAARENK